MKINYGAYTFNDGNADNNVYNRADYDSSYDEWFNERAFNQTIFNQFIQNRQYEEAANYAAQYRFADPVKQKELDNYILDIRRQGRILGAVYGRLQGASDPNEPKSVLKQTEFYENLFVDGGLEHINQNNQYLKDFVDYKRRLGSAYDLGVHGDGHIINEAVALKVTFIPHKRTGMLGQKRVANEYSIDVFYSNSGLNKQDLQKAGVSISVVDGCTILKFDKSNPLANRIIASIPYAEYPGQDSDIERPKGLPRVIGINAKGQEIAYGHEKHPLNGLQSMIKDAKNTRDMAFKEIDNTKKMYSSTIGPALDDSLMNLNAALASGQISETEYNRQVKLGYSYVEQAVKTLGSGNYKMYSNAFNENMTDESLSEMSNKQRGQLSQLISFSNIKNMYFNAMVSNGQIGTLITIDATQVAAKDQSDTSNPSKLVNTRRYQIFIPGLMQEQAQKAINSDTASRAAQEVNAMQDFGYEYTLDDGTKLVADGQGGFTHGESTVSTEEATRLINKSMIVEDGVTNLKYKYMNKDGEIFDEKGYEAASRKLAVAACNELYPDVSLADSKGNKYTVDQLFAMRSVGSDVLPKYANKLQYEVYNKIKEIFDIYDKLMAKISNN